MSSAGQAVGGIVGAIVGFFVGGGPTGALYGAQVGMLAGSYLDPPKLPTTSGPRISDLTVQTSTYGAVIPRVYGAAAVTGNIIWVEGGQIKETITVSKQKSGGKGGGSKAKTRTYSYSATFAVGICEGPIVGIRRIWIGPELWYDAGATDPETIVASNAQLSNVGIYLGTSTQSPDPRIQAEKGAGSTPAWLGLAYLVFYDLQLAKYGNSLAGAQVKVEVVQSGNVDPYPYATSDVSNSVYRSVAFDGTVFCGVSANSPHNAVVSEYGFEWTEYTTGISGYVYGVCSDGAGTLLAYGNALIYKSTDHGVTWTDVSPSGISTPVVSMAYNGSSFLAITDNTYRKPFYTSSDGTFWEPQNHNIAFSGAYGFSGDSPLLWHQESGKWYFLNPDSGSYGGIFSSPTGIGASWTNVRPRGSDIWTVPPKGCVHKGRILFCVGAGANTVLWSDDGTNWNLGDCNFQGSAWVSDGDRVWVIQGRFSAGNVAGNYSDTGIGDWTSWTGPMSSNHSAICVRSTIVCLPIGGAPPDNAYVINKLFVGAGDILLSSIVSSECLLTGLLSSGDIDVSALTQGVHGIRIGSVGSVRSVLEALQSAYFFDARQHGYKIQFVNRGGSAVVTIASSDLDARSDGAQPGVSVTLSREMDSQLPRRVLVRHLDPSREYDAGEQYAERLITAARGESTVDLPIVLSTAEAAGLAEVLLYLYWMERIDVSFRLPPTYQQIEPADVVTVPTSEGSMDVRVTQISYTSDGRLECAGKPARPAVYTAAALGVGSSATGVTTIGAAGATSFMLLDLPRISGEQDAGALLAIGYGSTSGWPGGVLLQSTDSGANWYSVADFERPGGAAGSATNTIGSADARIIDAASVLAVTLVSGDLYSVAESSMLAGENHFAYGAHGRWEIIAARTCALVSGKSYNLSNMLRGRFGTESAMSTHQVGDSVVLLDAGHMLAVGMSSSAIGVPYLYRGITIGEDIGSDINHSFTFSARYLLPLSPVYLNGSIDPSSGDWSLTWMRRTRVGGDWRDGVDAELGETTEKYEIDIFSDGSYAVVKRTIAMTSSVASYPSTQQVSDFGSNQSTLYLRVYQLSGSVGRGTALQTSITR